MEVATTSLDYSGATNFSVVRDDEVRGYANPFLIEWDGCQLRELEIISAFNCKECQYDSKVSCTVFNARHWYANCMDTIEATDTS